MIIREFAEKAIKNGYTGNRCEGWNWIRANLQELDHTLRLKEYEAADGMQYKCMPFLLADKTLTELEKDALATAWFCNNERVRREKANTNKVAMIEAGYQDLTEDIVKEAYAQEKKLLVIAKMSADWMTQKIENIYRPYIDRNGVCYLMKPRARSRGFHLTRFENAFCKII